MNLKLIFLTFLFFQSIFTINANIELRFNKQVPALACSAVVAGLFGYATYACAKLTAKEFNKAQNWNGVEERIEAEKKIREAKTFLERRIANAYQYYAYNGQHIHYKNAINAAAITYGMGMLCLISALVPHITERR